MDLALLDGELKARGEPAYRSKQVWAWLARGARGFDEMTDVPAALRGELAEAVPLSTLTRRPGGDVARRHGEGALPHPRRPSGRGGTHALPRRTAFDLPLLPVGLPAHLHVLRDGLDAVPPQPDRVGDPRPGAPLPAGRRRRPLRLHGHGRADAQPRPRPRGARGACPTSGSRTGGRRSRRSAGFPVCAASSTRSTSRSGSRSRSTQQTRSSARRSCP